MPTRDGRLMRLPVSALLLHLILSSPTVSSGRSPPQRRLWTPLRASGDAYDEGGSSDGRKGGGGGGGAFEPFERVVRRVTQNDDYQFGDLTKNVIGSTAHSFEDAVRSVTGKTEYQFGDLARGTVRRAGSIMTYSEKTLGALRDHNIHEMMELLNIYWSRSMNEDERKEAFTVFVYLGAISILAYSFVANLTAGMVFAAAWTKVSMATGESPLSKGNWRLFMEAKSTMDIFVGGPCVPARAILTIPWFFNYRNFVVALTYKSPLREKFPIINRYLSLILSWLVANLAFVGGVTFLMVKMGSYFSGVPVFPIKVL